MRKTYNNLHAALSSLSLSQLCPKPNLLASFSRAGTVQLAAARLKRDMHSRVHGTPRPAPRRPRRRTTLLPSLSRGAGAPARPRARGPRPTRPATPAGAGAGPSARCGILGQKAAAAKASSRAARDQRRACPSVLMQRAPGSRRPYVSRAPGCGARHGSPRRGVGRSGTSGGVARATHHASYLRTTFVPSRGRRRARAAKARAKAGQRKGNGALCGIESGGINTVGSQAVRESQIK